MRILKEKGHSVLVTSKTKDVLTKLLQESNIEFINIAARERKDSRLGILASFFQRTRTHWRIVRQFKPHLFISTSAEFAPFAKLLGIKSIAVFEDDLEIFPVYSKVFVPFLDHQLCPESCSAAQWNDHPKTIKYKGNHELAYLRPHYFTPHPEKVAAVFEKDKLNFFIRFAKLTAWHDENKKGITDQLAQSIIEHLRPFGKIHISSERELSPELDAYRIKVKASDILDVLYYADLYLGDSQTMTAEAAVLGTPSIRFNDFVGKLGYLEELETTYGLTFGIPTNQPDQLLQKIDEIVATPDLKNKWQQKKNHLLKETIDPTKFFVWFFENYPSSAVELNNNPSLQERFKDHVS